MMTDLRTLPQRLSELDICIADKKSGHLLFEKGCYHYAYDSADSLPVWGSHVQNLKRQAN